VLGPSPFQSNRHEDWEAPFSSEADTSQFLEKVCIGAIILPEEDKLLEKSRFPGDLAGPDIDSWVRYKVANRRNPSFIIYDLSRGEKAF
jgi:hypothetical protein